MVDVLVAFDRSLFFLVNGLHHPVADLFFLSVTQLGNGWVITPVLAAIVVWKIPRKRLWRTVLVGVVALSLSGIVNSQVKRMVKRPRPPAFFNSIGASGKPGGGAAYPAIHSVGPVYHNKSFPSGHTNTAFSAAVFLVILLGGRWYLSFIPALLVGYSRVYLGVHFPLDVAGGAVLGTVITLCIMQLLLKRKKPLLSGDINGKR